MPPLHFEAERYLEQTRLSPSFVGLGLDWHMTSRLLCCLSAERWPDMSPRFSMIEPVPPFTLFFGFRLWRKFFYVPYHRHFIIESKNSVLWELPLNDVLFSPTWLNMAPSFDVPRAVNRCRISRCAKQIGMPTATHNSLQRIDFVEGRAERSRAIRAVT